MVKRQAEQEVLPSNRKESSTRRNCMLVQFQAKDAGKRFAFIFFVVSIVRVTMSINILISALDLRHTHLFRRI